jgi:beta-N-acetylhexosaminidase
MRYLALILVILCFAVILPHPVQSQREDHVETLLDEMTLEQKIGQMFMTTIYGTQVGDTAREFIAETTPGAVAIFGYNTEQPTPELAQFINDMQAASVESGANIPLIVAVDQEGGRVWRLVNDVTHFPEAMFMGAPTDPAALERVGAATGAELQAIGINMNLAPVADLQTRTDTLTPVRVMYRRTFGNDPERVGWQTAAYVRGMAEYNVIGVLKHFPGHGGAADSHAGLPTLDVDPEIAAETAFHAFEAAVEEGVPAIMVGHLYYSQVEPEENLPASLSPTMLGMLRDDFGFEGVIMTDAMDMGGLANNYYVPDAALMFVQAGGDMFVAGPHMEWEMQRIAMKRLQEAVTEGELSEARIDESVRRILKLKEAYGLLDWAPVDPAKVVENIQAADSETALTETFMDAATVLQNDHDLLPFQPGESVAIVYHTLSEDILSTCQELAPEAAFHGYNFTPAPWEYSTVAALGRDYDKIAFFTEDAFNAPPQAELARVLPPEKTVVVAMGLPYDLEVVGEPAGLLAMYDNRPASQIAACRVLFGEHPAQGRLPIDIEGFPSGSGIDVE